MKTPPPRKPRNAPPGTAWFGGPVEWFKITFRIRGDDLNPEEITSLLGVQPDRSERKGEIIPRKNRTAGRKARTGSWRLVLLPNDTDEWNCGEAMLAMMSRLPIDTELWQNLAGRFDIDFLVGLTMPSRNKGLVLSKAVMAYLGERGIDAGFDIYFEPK